MRQRWEIDEEENETHDRRRIRVRPGRTQSLVAGIVAIAMGLFVLVMFTGMGGLFPGGPIGGAFGLFPLLFLVVVLVIAVMSFYNAFSEKGVPTYEIDIESDRNRESNGGRYCPNCGEPVGERDRFCRNCGHPLHND
ncbi:MAG: zinc ribbon domain-containing protein [Chloroflexota bacterium]|nr:zinc ribbon domain-containing protein [Chloroflexota bacterium]